MKYFVDHEKAKIHERRFAGDKCGFVNTPTEKREFTDSLSYVNQLEKQKSYQMCPYCRVK